MADFTIQSMDISAIEQAPHVRFTFVDGDYAFEASPPGGHIRVDCLHEQGRVSRIVLTNTLTNEVFADVISHQQDTPSVGDDWTNSALYAAELACALYWSMWRMQQIKAGATRAPEEKSDD